MASYLDSVPMSGIIRIRDMMFTVASPFRLDQGDVSFDSPETVKSAMARAIAENRTHYVQTAGVPRLRELIAAKLRDKNHVPVDDDEQVLVSGGGIHALFIVFHALTWFAVAPQAIVAHIGKKRVPGALIAVSNYGAWIVVSAALIWFLLR